MKATNELPGLYCKIGGITNAGGLGWVQPQDVIDGRVPEDPFLNHYMLFAGRYDAITQRDERDGEYDDVAVTYRDPNTEQDIRRSKVPNDDFAITELNSRAFDYPSLQDILTKRTCAGLGSRGKSAHVAYM